MITTLKPQVSNPSIKFDSGHREYAASRRTAHRLRLPDRPFVSLCLKSNNVSFTAPPSDSNLKASVGSPPSPPPSLQWIHSQRHFLVFNYIACATAVSATLLFCAAIPTLLAFKRAAESAEKLLDVTREEIPGTMAAIRLSGMELSDLTMELSDLGQGITRGVKSSTRVARVVEESLRRITNRAPSGYSKASMQEVIPMKTEKAEPVVARAARGIREGIVKSRSALQMFFMLTKFAWLAFGYFSSRAKF